MSIENLTVKELQDLIKVLKEDFSEGLNDQIGEKVIVRTYSAGVWFGTLSKKSGNEVYIKNARRMHGWKAKKGISLSAVAKYGVEAGENRLCPALKRQWLEAIEILDVEDACIKSIENEPDFEAQ